MHPVIKNNHPSTYIITLTENVRVITIRERNGNIYFYRYLPYGAKRIKVNIPDKGIYTIDCSCVIIRKPIEICKEVYNISLPPKERNREKPYHIIHDENLKGSPAIIYTHTGKIVTGEKFKKLSVPMRIFILLHEVGHFRYTTEKYCDLYATIEFIKMGYNPSNAIYCLTDILKDNPQNDERINYIYRILSKHNIIKNGIPT